MKKLTAVAAAVCLAVYLSVPALAESSRAACVLEQQTGAIIYEKNSVERLPMASTTKIMTCVTALESCSADETVTVSPFAASQEGSSAYLRAGDMISMYDLLFGLMLNSGNDAAVAAAEHTAGSVEAFAEMMNKKAAEIGLGNTHFVNPNGLPDDNHYTSAYDLAELTRYAMNNETFREIVSAKSFTARIINTGRTIEFTNHNRLLGEYEGCLGVKTGYTKAAGRCLVAAAERGGMTFIAVTLNDGDDWKDHKELLDGAFSQYSPETVAKKGGNAPGTDYDLIYGEDLTVPVKNGNRLKFRVKLHVPKKLSLPVAAGEKVGYAEFTLGGESVGRVDVCSAADLYEEPAFGERLFKKLGRVCERILF